MIKSLSSKKLTPIILSTFLCVVILGLFSACDPMINEDQGDNTPTDEEHDYRTFYTNKKIDYGKISDSYHSDLVMYFAGNQFMVIEDLIQDFQTKNPDINKIYIETIPPGQILKTQLLKQGMINGENTTMNPDLFATVNVNHLKKLHEKGLMSQYIIYTHNKLELMIAKGNPKNIKGVKDLGRDDIVQSHPNPVTEGVFKYTSAMLKDLGLFEKVTGNAYCKGCWAVPEKTWFTERHHRETPYRIENGQADTGLVWTTEVAYAKIQNRPIDGVIINPPYNQQSKVDYVIGAMLKAKNSANAHRFIKYMASKAAQDIYISYGFIPATASQLQIKSL